MRLFFFVIVYSLLLSAFLSSTKWLYFLDLILDVWAQNVCENEQLIEWCFIGKNWKCKNIHISNVLQNLSIERALITVRLLTWFHLRCSISNEYYFLYILENLHDLFVLFFCCLGIMFKPQVAATYVASNFHR